jgi:hypothetical protein
VQSNDRQKNSDRLRKFKKLVLVWSWASIPLVFFLLCTTVSRYGLYFGGVASLYVHIFAGTFLYDRLERHRNHQIVVLCSWLLAIGFQYRFGYFVKDTIFDGDWDDVEMATMTFLGFTIVLAPMLWAAVSPVPPPPPWSNRAKIARAKGDDSYDRAWKAYWKKRWDTRIEEEERNRENADSSDDEDEGEARRAARRNPWADDEDGGGSDDGEDIDIDALKEEIKESGMSIYEMGLSNEELYALGFPPEGGTMSDWEVDESEGETVEGRPVGKGKAAGRGKPPAATDSSSPSSSPSDSEAESFSPSRKQGKKSSRTRGKSLKEEEVELLKKKKKKKKKKMKSSETRSAKKAGKSASGM